MSAVPSLKDAVVGFMRAPQSTCEHCGMGITNCIIVQNPDGTKGIIGTTCADHIGGDVAICAREHLTHEQLLVKRAQHDARLAERERHAAMVAEWLVRRLAEIKDLVTALEEAGVEYGQSVAWQIEHGRPSFYVSLAQQLRNGPLSERQAVYVAKLIVGRCTKKTEDAWYGVVERCMAEPAEAFPQCGK